jgi:S-adenosylmethionine:tRNA ribosyltransferase-isomerase
VGETVMLHDRAGGDAFPLLMLAKLGDGLWAARPQVPGEALQLLEQVGRVPLPPYIRDGEMEESDVAQYQTVYARRDGAIAAPTAGLHFTDALLADVTRRGVQLCYLTLHVGVGTFRPMAVERVEDHHMHSEWGEVSAETVERLQACRAAGGRVVAVGTTCTRVLETAARDGQLRPWQGTTDLFIRPPFQFHATDVLMTNFHLPRSTLLILVRTFGGDALMRRAYQVAIEENYRFYSYGDAMLIL